LAQSGFNSLYSALWTTNTAATSSYFEMFEYVVEGYDYQQIHGKKVRLQFWVKSSASGTYSLVLAGGGATTRSYVTTYTVTAANTWQKVAIDIQLETLSAGFYNFDNTAGLYLFWILGGNQVQTSTLNAWQTGSFYGTSSQTSTVLTTIGATFQIAQVSVIPQDFTLAGASNVDIPFQRAGRTIQQELAMCQRYYEKSYEVDVAPGTATATGRVTVAATAQTSSVMTLGSITPFKVQKRTPPPSVAFYNSGSGASGTWQYFSPGNNLPTNFSATLNLASSNGFEINNSGSPGFPTTTAFLALGHFVADAEL
jgi:hypothetical protein